LQIRSSTEKNIIILGRSCKGASYWLTTAPNVYAKTIIEPASFRAILKYNVGMKMVTSQSKCPDCGISQDSYGHHALSCKVASGFIDKHDAIVDNIYSLLSKV
jgi:hypothetical protein